ncbi:ATP-binding protein [Aminobacterium colombiense]
MKTTVKRKIITIDEEKCDGCGICAQACHEGAIQIIDGKAKLVSESYCDGLGDCIGECPRGAITFEEREAAPYDEEGVKRHMASKALKTDSLPCGCPGTMAKDLRNMVSSSKIEAPVEIQSLQSRLGNWPVQIKLVPDNAPYLRNADLVIAADCTAYAMADFHGKFLGGEKTVCLIGCPKLDDAQTYEKKITQIIALNEPESITVVYMEVPCCGGLVRLITAAIEHAKVNVALKLVKIGIQGQIIEKETTKYVFSK